MEATTLAGHGYDVRVICPKGKGYDRPLEDIDGVSMYRHELAVEGNSTITYLIEYGQALYHESSLALRLYRRKPFDVLHICNPPDLMFLFALWFRLRHGVTIVFDHHDISPELYEAKKGKRDFFYHALRLVERLTFLSAHVVITTGESYRRIAIRRGRKRPEDVIIVRSGPDMSKFCPQAPLPEYKRGRRYLIGYVGVMGPQEGIDYLLRAAQIIVSEFGRRDISFMLIGSGPAFAGLKALAQELELSEFVEFTGRIPDDELVARLSTCDVCVNPDPYSPFNDASVMNKVLEYMALARPVVQFDLTEGRRSAGPASAYAGNNDARSLAETIVAVLGDEPRRAEMGAEGYRRMRDELEWRHQVPRLLSAYSLAMARRSARRRKRSRRARH